MNADMVSRLKSEGYIMSSRIEKAFLSVDRKAFVPEEMKRYAYDDYPLTIPGGQTISAPHMYAIMLEAVCPRENERILEIGGGSGYGAALLSKLVKSVITIEIIPETYEFCRKNLEGYRNIDVVLGDGSIGYEKSSPYEIIIMTASSPEVPRHLLSQLKEGGRLIAPIGRGEQELVMIEKTKSGTKEKRFGHVVFVPLTGEKGI